MGLSPGRAVAKPLGTNLGGQDHWEAAHGLRAGGDDAPLSFLSGFEHAQHTHLPLLAWNPRGTKAPCEGTGYSPGTTWALQKCPSHSLLCLLDIALSPKGPGAALPPSSHPQEPDLQRSILFYARHIAPRPPMSLGLLPSQALWSLLLS